jgi:hypothetical protein
MDLLFDGLGEIEALRFLIIYNSRLYNYTEWHEHLWEDKCVDEIASMCREFRHEHSAAPVIPSAERGIADTGISINIIK